MKKITRSCLVAGITLASLFLGGNVQAQNNFTQLAVDDTIFNSPDTLNWNFTGAPVNAFGTATVTVFYEGDFGATSEFITIYDENNNALGTTHAYFDGSDCMQDSAFITFPASLINTWNADNVINFTGVTESAVGNFCTANHANIRLSYNYCPTGPVASLSIPATSFCSVDAPVALSFAPAGGTLSGTGISGNNFDPSGLAPGAYTLGYTFTNVSGCTSDAYVTVHISPGPFVSSVSPDTICPWNVSTLSAQGTGHIVWYSDAGLTTPVDTGNIITTPQLMSTTTYYAATTLFDKYFQITSLSDTNYVVIDHDSITGDDRGGIAVTMNYIYMVGDDSTGRFDLNLQNPTKYARMDGLVSDLGNGTLYTLYNPLTGIPDADVIDSMYVTELRTLNPDLTLGTGVLTLSDSIPFGWDNSYNYQSGVFAGNGFVILFSAPRMSWYVIDLQDGVVTNLGTITDPQMNYSETWAAYGVAEFDGVNYSVLFRDVNDNDIHRRVLPDQPETVAFPFSDLSDLASFTYAPWNHRWYLHFEGGSQFNGNSETLVYADAMDSTGAEIGTSTILCPASATVVVATCTGIQESTLAGVSVYPNPNDGRFTISVSNMENALVEITSLDGRLVYSERFASSNEKTLDLSAFANGVYFVRVSNEKSVLSTKLVKQ